MKKIIATVLAMVMALALCTTAFAVSSVYAGAAVGTDTIKPADGQVLSLEKFSTGSADAKTFDTYKLWLRRPTSPSPSPLLPAILMAPATWSI